MRVLFGRMGLALCLALGLGLVVAPTQAATGPWITEAAGWRYRTVDTGTQYESPRGSYTVRAPYFDARHRSLGGGRGLGYPLSEEVNVGGGAYLQPFERGVIHVTRGVATVVLTGSDPIGAVHTAAGGGTGSLGFPLADAVAQNRTFSYQRFQNGVVYASPAGAYAVQSSGRPGSDVLATHTARGGGSGDLGYPVSRFVREAAGHGYQRFERGVVYERIVGSSASSAVVRGGFLPAHAATGGGRGSLGYPISDESVVWVSPREWAQDFERGTIYINSFGPTVCLVGQSCAG